MPFTYLNLKNAIRTQLWPAGEARSRRPAHNQWFVDALIEIQRYVECFQQNNTNLMPHCSTLFNCGLTSFDFPRAAIKKLSVVNAPPKKLEDIEQESVDVFTTNAALSTDSWPGYPNTINQGINNAFAPLEDPPNVRFHYETATIVTAYALDVVAGSGLDRPSETISFLLEGSNDNGATWTEVDAQSLTIDADTPRQTVDVSVTNETAYFDYRLSVGSVGENFNVWGIFLYGLSFTGYSAASLAGEIDWCTEIPYDQVDFCHVRDYLVNSSRAGCCLPLHLFFGLPQACLSGKGTIPVPTGAGLPPGLPVMELGYKYPQTSTDSSRRAMRGRWAIDRGRVYVAPWIQSSETIVVKWDGIKREYTDGDLIEADPALMRCVRLFVQKEYERDDNRDAQASAAAEREYRMALQDLWKDCRDETMVRGQESSKARGATPLVTLYYNDSRSYTANCPSGKVGDPKTVTIPAGMVSSAISKQDANNQASQQAQEQATATLACVDAPVQYWNREVQGRAECTQEDGAPAPDGSPVNITIPAGQYSSTVSEDAATAIAQDAADAQAAGQLTCTFWNRAQTFPEPCPESHDVTVAAHTYSSSVSQSDADSKALNAAKAEAEALCPDVFDSTQQIAEFIKTCPGISANHAFPFVPCKVTVRVTVAAAYSTSVISQTDANTQAYNHGLALAQQVANAICTANTAAYNTPGFEPECGIVARNLP